MKSDDFSLRSVHVWWNLWFLAGCEKNGWPFYEILLCRKVGMEKKREFVFLFTITYLESRFFFTGWIRDRVRNRQPTIQHDFKRTIPGEVFPHESYQQKNCQEALELLQLQSDFFLIKKAFHCGLLCDLVLVETFQYIFKHFHLLVSFHVREVEDTVLWLVRYVLYCLWRHSRHVVLPIEMNFSEVLLFSTPTWLLSPF